MNKLSTNLALLLLMTAVLGMIVSATGNGILASTDNGSDSNNGEDTSNSNSGNNEDQEDDSEPEPETEPEPEAEPEAEEPEQEQELEPLIEEPLAEIIEEEPIDCSWSYDPETGECVGPPETEPEPIDDELIEDEPELEPLPYCDQVGYDYTGSCHDRYDWDDNTGLYPCNDGTQKDDPLDCPDVTQPITEPPLDPSPYPSPEPEPGPPDFCLALGCPGSPPDPVRGCDDGRDPVNGYCPVPPADNPNSCKDGFHFRDGKCIPDDKDNDDKERKKIHIIKVIKNVEIIKKIQESNDDLDIDRTLIAINYDEGAGINCVIDEDDKGQCEIFDVTVDKGKEPLLVIIPFS